MSGCETDTDVGAAIISLMAGAVQATVMGVLGPFVLYFGRDISNIVCVVQACLLADFEQISAMFVGFCPAKLPILSKYLLSVVMSTVGITFGMIKDQGFQAAACAITLGQIAVRPLMGTISVPILKEAEVNTCKATPEFPAGAPCMSNSASDSLVDLCEIEGLTTKAMAAIWFLAGLPTLVAVILAMFASYTYTPPPEEEIRGCGKFCHCIRYIISTFASMVRDLSFAFTGAFMVLKAFLDIGIPIWMVADRCSAEKALPAINGFQLAGTYGLGGLSFLWVRLFKLIRGGKEPSGFVARLDRKIGKMVGKVAKFQRDLNRSVTASHAGMESAGELEQSTLIDKEDKDEKVDSFKTDPQDKDSAYLRHTADASADGPSTTAGMEAASEKDGPSTAATEAKVHEEPIHPHAVAEEDGPSTAATEAKVHEEPIHPPAVAVGKVEPVS